MYLAFKIVSKITLFGDTKLTIACYNNVNIFLEKGKKMKRIIILACVFATCFPAWGMAEESITTSKLDRTVLPITEPKPPLYTELDVRKATPPPHFQVKAPDGAPNVVLVLLDDLGFAGTSRFGGPVDTPNFDKIANEGIYYNNFHTTAVCSSTRAALKSGRNHQVNNMGSIIETGTAFPGNTGQIPQNVAPLAEMLRLNGYSTAAFGKWHELAAWEASVSGPFDRWPTRQGFDKFYGFLGRGNKPVGACLSMMAHTLLSCLKTLTTIL